MDKWLNSLQLPWIKKSRFAAFELDCETLLELMQRYQKHLKLQQERNGYTIKLLNQLGKLEWIYTIKVNIFCV